MTRRLGRRALLAVVTLLLSTALLYVAIRLVPGTPWADDPATPSHLIDRWAERHFLDRGYAWGYLSWLRSLAAADLGESYALAPGEPVAAMVARAAPVSLLLGLLGYGLALALSLGFGLGTARRPGGGLDRGTSAVFYLLYAAPTFWIAMLLQDLFSLRLGWLPPLGARPLETDASGLVEAVPHWILPSACIALGSLAFLFRFTRASLLDGIRAPHVRAGRARGLPEGALLGRHAFSATRIDLVTLLGLLAPAVIGGSVIVEEIFALPGLGRLFLRAVGARDYPVLMGIGLLMAVVSVAASAAADMLYLAVEPRLRGSRRWAP